MARYITDAALTAEPEVVEDWAWEDAQLDDADRDGWWDE